MYVTWNKVKEVDVLPTGNIHDYMYTFCARRGASRWMSTHFLLTNFILLSFRFLSSNYELFKHTYLFVIGRKYF